MRYANEGPRWADDSHFSVNERYGLLTEVTRATTFGLIGKKGA
jgi:hypothetical protein